MLLARLLRAGLHLLMSFAVLSFVALRMFLV